jgi:hypothetical protein
MDGSQEGITPLYAAAREGALEVVNLLLERGACVDAVSSVRAVAAVTAHHCCCISMSAADSWCTGCHSSMLSFFGPTRPTRARP